MPHILRFHDTDEGPVSLPEASQVGHAATWAAERGYWDVATCLMELAQALAQLEVPAPAPAAAWAIPDAFLAADPNLEAKRDSHTVKLLGDPVPLGAHQCEHGYWTAHNRHVATGGVCDLSAGTGV